MLLLLVNTYNQVKNIYLYKRFVTPDEFEEYEKIGKALGFRHVESGALVRSSYKAHKHIL